MIQSGAGRKCERIQNDAHQNWAPDPPHDSHMICVVVAVPVQINSRLLVGVNLSFGVLHFNFGEKHQIVYLLISNISITIPNQHTLFIRAACTVKCHIRVQICWLDYKYLCKDSLLKYCSAVGINNRCALVVYISNRCVLCFCKLSYTQDAFHLCICIYRLTQMSFKAATCLGALWKVSWRFSQSSPNMDILSGVCVCDAKGCTASDAAATGHGCGRSLDMKFLSLRKRRWLQDRRLCCRGCPSPRRHVSTLRSSWRLCAGTRSACRTPALDCRHSTPSCRWPDTNHRSRANYWLKLFVQFGNKRAYYSVQLNESKLRSFDR